MAAIEVMPFPSVEHALDLCAQHVRFVRQAAAILRAGLGQPGALDPLARSLADVEREADRVTEQVVALVRRMGATPAERAALVELAHALEDVLDDVDAALTRMLLFRLPSTSPLAAALIGVLIRQAEALERALALVREREAPAALGEHLTLARGLAAEGEGLLVEGLAGLRGDTLDLAGMVDWLKWSEVHRPLGSAIRRGRAAAEAIEALAARLR